MEKIRLGRTELMVGRCGFGALPIQRTSMEEAVSILRKAFEGGINFFDTARLYTDSEQKLGEALSAVRSQIIIATKSMKKTREAVLSDLETSLDELKTDHVDILQLHNPTQYPDPSNPESAYNGLLEAQRRGMTRFIGISNHKLDLIDKAVRSGLYDTVQYPLSPISTEKELELAETCKKFDVGLIAMKALAGGLLNSPRASFAFLRQYTNIVPIWGIEKEWQLTALLGLERNPPLLDKTLILEIEEDRRELGHYFCRGCGYCLPCPEGIPINNAARMKHLVARSAPSRFLNPDWKAKMELIQNCRSCGHCSEHCPYGLDTPAVLKEMLEQYVKDYTEYSEHTET